MDFKRSPPSTSAPRLPVPAADPPATTRLFSSDPRWPTPTARSVLSPFAFPPSSASAWIDPSPSKPRPPSFAPAPPHPTHPPNSRSTRTRLPCSSLRLDDQIFLPCILHVHSTFSILVARILRLLLYPLAHRLDLALFIYIVHRLRPSTSLGMYRSCFCFEVFCMPLLMSIVWCLTF